MNNERVALAKVLNWACVAQEVEPPALGGTIICPNCGQMIKREPGPSQTLEPREDVGSNTLELNYGTGNFEDRDLVAHEEAQDAENAPEDSPADTDKDDAPAGGVSCPGCGAYLFAGVGGRVTHSVRGRKHHK